ncbi:MAG: response regulator [Bacteroidota bacterium]
MTELKQDQDFLFFAPEKPVTATVQTECWNILIIDDENSVHDVTRFAMKGFIFEGRQMKFHSVFSAAEAIELLRSRAQDFRVILLDIVMEHRRAGLEVITFLREELKNKQIQIVVRTGNPGLAPEDQLIQHFEINNYEEKNVLTVQRLKTSLTAALRAYQNIEAIQKLVSDKLDEIRQLRQTLRHVTFATDIPATGTPQQFSPISLPVFLKRPRPYQVNDPEPEQALQTVADIGMTLQFIQGKIASTARKAIAIFDYTTYSYRYVSDNFEEITGLGWQDMIQKLSLGGHYSPDMYKIDKINKLLTKAYSESSEFEQARFTAVFDYRITLDAPHNIRMCGTL